MLDTDCASGNAEENEDGAIRYLKTARCSIAAVTLLVEFAGLCLVRELAVGLAAAARRVHELASRWRRRRPADHALVKRVHRGALDHAGGPVGMNGARQGSTLTPVTGQRWAHEQPDAQRPMTMTPGPPRTPRLQCEPAGCSQQL